MQYFKIIFLLFLTTKALFGSNTCQIPMNGLIGVTDVEIANKTARLVFNEAGIQTQSAIALKETNCFNVLDWQRLKDVIQRNKIELSDLKNSQEQRERFKQLLAVDYFFISPK